jgi:hypothetical protein
MRMLIKQGRKGYTGAALAWRRVEVAIPRDPDTKTVSEPVPLPALQFTSPTPLFSPIFLRPRTLGQS